MKNFDELRKNQSAERRLKVQLGAERQRTWGDVWQIAYDWAIANHPTQSLHHRAAFANSVAYLVTGASGGSGPSMREHLVSWSLARGGEISSLALGDEAITVLHPDGTLPMAGQWRIEDAIAHCSPLCFDPAEKYLKTLLQIQEREYCFDDDPADIEALRGK